jgi:hypothetical protein
LIKYTPNVNKLCHQFHFVYRNNSIVHHPTLFMQLSKPAILSWSVNAFFCNIHSVENARDICQEGHSIRLATSHKRCFGESRNSTLSTRPLIWRLDKPASYILMSYPPASIYYTDSFKKCLPRDTNILLSYNLARVKQ